MHKKLVQFSLVLILVTGIITTVFAFVTAKNNYTLQARQHLEDIYSIYEETLAQGEDPQSLAREISRLTGIRITWMERDGSVLFDTTSTAAEQISHKDRPEFKEALSTGSGYAKRYSESEHRQVLYLAHMQNGDVIRLSLPLESLGYLNENTFLLIFSGLLLAFLLAFVISMYISRSISAPVKEIADAAYLVAQGQDAPALSITSNDEIGELAKSFGIMTSHLKESIAGLHEKNAMVSAIVNSITEALVALDESGKVLLANTAAMDLFRLPGKAIGGEFASYVRSESIQAFIQSGKEADMSELSFENGIYKMVKTPIRSINSGCVILFENVTEVRKLERMKSEFVSNVTHELKTPLTSIKGFAETLKAGAIEDKEASIHFAEIIEIEADRLRSLIDDILSLSSIEAQETDTDVTRFDLRTVFREVADLVSPIAQEKKVDIRLELPTAPLWAMANPERMKQLLLNLMGNAVTYNKEGGTVTVSGQRKANQLIIGVSDTGIGIPPEHLDRIFERFYTVDKGRSRENGGTGLGLSIVKHIAALYGGSVRAESTPGQGSTFIATLPIATN